MVAPLWYAIVRDSGQRTAGSFRPTPWTGCLIEETDELEDFATPDADETTRSGEKPKKQCRRNSRHQKSGEIGRAGQRETTRETRHSAEGEKYYDDAEGDRERGWASTSYIRPRQLHDLPL